MTITPTGTWKKPRMKVYDYNQVFNYILQNWAAFEYIAVNCTHRKTNAEKRFPCQKFLAIQVLSSFLGLKMLKDKRTRQAIHKSGPLPVGGLSYFISILRY